MRKHEMWGNSKCSKWHKCNISYMLGFLWSKNLFQEKEKLKYEDLEACFKNSKNKFQLVREHVKGTTQYQGK